MARRLFVVCVGEEVADDDMMLNNGCCFIHYEACSSSTHKASKDPANKRLYQVGVAMDAVVFIYMGAGGASIPHDVVRARVDPSVTLIPARSFEKRKKLAEVELCEGLVEIGDSSFTWCDRSITKINIPFSLKRIGDDAFICSLRAPIRLHDDIESIGKYAFIGCIFTHFRVPPLITMIPKN
jgi:hypothetical protein